MSGVLSEAHGEWQASGAGEEGHAASLTAYMREVNVHITQTSCFEPALYFAHDPVPRCCTAAQGPALT